MIKLMYITNSVDIARIVEDFGVERIFVDMEYIGKDIRQGGMNTVQNHHTVEDVKAIRKAISKAELLVRCNPIHEKSEGNLSSKEEIDAIVESGADIIMLPYFKTVEEVKIFVDLVGGRAKTMPLVETAEAVAVIDDILEIDGIDEIFIGLNDLSLSYGMSFMFELLSNGLVETLCKKFKAKGIPYGFGGIASLGKGLLNSEMVIKEHYRLGSTSAILSRSFCNSCNYENLGQISEIFNVELGKIRELEKFCAKGEIDFVSNQEHVKNRVNEIVSKMGKQQ
ncbi:MAG: aldolase [Clostridia bacterium]|nr:aldolase [Clostridia bacterium]